MADWQRAIRIVDEIDEAIDELDEDVRDRGADFFESVAGRAESIRETILRNRSCTERQLEALENMLSGVRKWQNG